MLMQQNKFNDNCDVMANRQTTKKHTIKGGVSLSVLSVLSGSVFAFLWVPDCLLGQNRQNGQSGQNGQNGQRGQSGQTKWEK